MTSAKLSGLAAAILATTVAAPLAAQDRGPVGTVTLARTDYDLLLDLAARPPRPSDGAPLPAALTRADLRVRVDAGTGTGNDGSRWRGLSAGRRESAAHQPGDTARCPRRRSTVAARRRRQCAPRHRQRARDILRDARVGHCGHDVPRPRLVHAAGSSRGERHRDFRRPRRAVRSAGLSRARRTQNVGRRPLNRRSDPRSGIADDGVVVGSRDGTGSAAS